MEVAFRQKRVGKLTVGEKLKRAKLIKLVDTGISKKDNYVEQYV